QRAAARARAYENDILPRARTVAGGAEFAFSKGAIPLTDLLDARRVLRLTLLEALTARTDYAKALGAWQLRTRPESVVPAR
ncbi:MAG: TolC family protein, partial [Burkholderiales bacterium]